MSKILIAGATGNIANRVTKRLLEAKQTVIVGVRTPEKVSDLKGLGAEIRVFDFEKKETHADAFKGVDVAFFGLPGSPKLGEFNVAAIDSAKAAGVKFIIQLSAASIFLDIKADHPGKQHAIGDEYLRKSGVDYAIVGPNFFTSNFLRLADQIKKGSFTGAAGEKKIAYIHPDDIADVIVAIALNPEKYKNQTYQLHGDIAFSEYEVAAFFSGALGKEVRYNSLATLEEYKEALKKRSLPEFLIGLFLWLERVKHAGEANIPDDTVEKVTGKKARTVLAWILENKTAFES